MLTLKALSKTVADDILFIILFIIILLEKILLATWNGYIHVKYQVLFSLKKKTTKKKQEDHSGP